MSIEVVYANLRFNLQFSIQDNIVTLHHDKMCGSVESFIMKDLIFIVGNGTRAPRFSKNEKGEKVENDISFINRNVHCFNWNGELLWKIQPPHIAHLCEGGRIYSMQPYTEIFEYQGRLAANNWNGWNYYLDIDSGAVKPIVMEGDNLNFFKKS